MNNTYRSNLRPRVRRNKQGTRNGRRFGYYIGENGDIIKVSKQPHSGAAESLVRQLNSKFGKRAALMRQELMANNRKLTQHEANLIIYKRLVGERHPLSKHIGER